VTRQPYRVPWERWPLTETCQKKRRPRGKKMPPPPCIEKIADGFTGGRFGGLAQWEKSMKRPWFVKGGNSSPSQGETKATGPGESHGRPRGTSFLKRKVRRGVFRERIDEAPFKWRQDAVQKGGKLLVVIIGPRKRSMEREGSHRRGLHL